MWTYVGDHRCPIHGEYAIFTQTLLTKVNLIHNYFDFRCMIYCFFGKWWRLCCTTCTQTGSWGQRNMTASLERVVFCLASDSVTCRGYNEWRSWIRREMNGEPSAKKIRTESPTTAARWRMVLFILFCIFLYCIMYVSEITSVMKTNIELLWQHYLFSSKFLLKSPFRPWTDLRLRHADKFVVFVNISRLFSESVLLKV